MRIQTFDGIIYCFRYDPVPYCGVYRRRKPKPPYNKRASFLNSIQEEENRPFKDHVCKEVICQNGGGCMLCYRYLSNYGRHTDRCWKTSYKCRKQWMKHQKKHYPTLNISPHEEFDDS